MTDSTQTAAKMQDNVNTAVERVRLALLAAFINDHPTDVCLKYRDGEVTFVRTFPGEGHD